MKRSRGTSKKEQKDKITESELSIPKRRFRFEEIGILGALIVFGAIMSILSPYFLTATNLLRIGRQASYFGILAVGMSFVIGSGQIDISVGRQITLISFFLATLMRAGVTPWIAILLGLGLGAICGLFNGSLVLIFKVHPMIVTLATQFIFWGLAVALSDARPIVLNKIESAYFTLGQGKIFGVPVPFLVFIFIALTGNLILKKTQFGRHVLAVGANRRASVYAGINEKKIRLLVMMLSGIFAGLAASVYLSFFQTFEPNMGALMEMDAIAASVIGGADLTGGYATALGAFFGSFLIGLLRNGLVLIGIGAYWNNFVTGSVILIAIIFSTVLKSGRKR